MGSPSEDPRRGKGENVDCVTVATTKSDSGLDVEEGVRCAAAAPSKSESPQGCGQLEVPLKNCSDTHCYEVYELRSPELQQGGAKAGREEGDDGQYGSNSDSKRARGGPTGKSRQLPTRGIEQRVRIESLDEYIKALLISQIKEPIRHVEEGLMVLLKRCLESEQTQGTQSALALCSYVEHFESRLEEDLGWGCGWRNIQMMSSHLLAKDEETRDALFGGAGFVPDISALQQWMEIAWAKGFDTQGAEHFNWNIAGTHKWIGTTECAALLRSFGVRARIVDFQTVGNKRDRESLLRDRSVCVSQDDSQQKPEIAKPGVASSIRRAPVEIVHGDCISCGEDIIQGPRFRKSSGVGKTDLCPTCMEQLLESTKEEEPQSIEEYMGIDETTVESREETGNVLPESSAAATGREEFLIDHRHLLDWVWNYFSGKPDTATSSSSSASLADKVTMSDRSPLYFQHKGHSRTVVGIQRKQIIAADSSPGSSSSKEDLILILDPSERTQDIVKSLRTKTGWQKLLKRSTQTLRHPEYQLCYVEPGIVYGEELEDLKLLSSVHYTY